MLNIRQHDSLIDVGVSLAANILIARFMMRLRWLLSLLLIAMPTLALAETPLPPLHDGVVVVGPGSFRHDGELLIQGKVTLRHITLNLHGPIRVAADATLELEDVHLAISDPDGAPNGTSGLRCDGPAHVIIRHSTMAPVGSAHPMWLLRGSVQVEDFSTINSEFHLNQVHAQLDRLKIFELEISHESLVTARGLDLVFLSSHTSENDHLQISGIPVDRAFSRKLALGSGANADLTDSRMQIFLLYLHGHAEASLAHIDRTQLAISPDCSGTLRLQKGRLGSDANPVVFPDKKKSNCPFHIALNDVNVDTWDVYAAGHADLTLEDSQIDELILNDHASILVRNSIVYADWLGVSGDTHLNVENSTVGALRLAAQRPDLATSQIRASGRSRATFSGVTFDCGVVASEDAVVEIHHALTPPKYTHHSGNSVILVDTATAPRPK